MKTPLRSAVLARALASEAPALPEDFAARVAARAEAGVARPGQVFGWIEAGLALGFVGMLGLCLAGWLRLGSDEPGGFDAWGHLASAASSQPWLVIGLAGFAIVQALTFRRRAQLRSDR